MSGKKNKSVSEGNRRGVIAIIIVVAVLICVLLVKRSELAARNQSYAAQIAELQEEITEAEDRSREIEALKQYTQSDEYVEKTAREKFGLVYPDEVIFRQED